MCGPFRAESSRAGMMEKSVHAALELCVRDLFVRRREQYADLGEHVGHAVLRVSVRLFHRDEAGFEEFEDPDEAGDELGPVLRCAEIGAERESVWISGCPAAG